MSKQEQSSGDNSMNLQANRDIIYHTGVTRSEVAEIAETLFRDNFLKLATEAAALADKRANRIITQLLTEAQRHGVDLHRARDPDVQYSLFTAQRDYARSGREDLCALLVGLLLRKFQTEPGNLTDLALSEAIETVRKLTQAQVNALTVSWFASRVVLDHLTSVEDLTNEFNIHAGPFIDRVPSGVSDYEHIHYTGCASVEMGHATIGNILLHRYPGLFQKGN